MSIEMRRDPSVVLLGEDVGFAVRVVHDAFELGASPDDGPAVVYGGTGR